MIDTRSDSDDEYGYQIGAVHLVSFDQHLLEIASMYNWVIDDSVFDYAVNECSKYMSKERLNAVEYLITEHCANVNMVVGNVPIWTRYINSPDIIKLFHKHRCVFRSEYVNSLISKTIYPQLLMSCMTPDYVHVFCDMPYHSYAYLGYHDSQLIIQIDQARVKGPQKKQILRFAATKLDFITEIIEERGDFAFDRVARQIATDSINAKEFIHSVEDKVNAKIISDILKLRNLQIESC